MRDSGSGIGDEGFPVTVAVDLLDEAHSLRIAMRRLATDPALRSALGAAGRTYWLREHAPERMHDDYHRAISRAMSTTDPVVPLPAHLVTSGDERLNALLVEMAGLALGVDFC
jgi:hypothetical protein